MSLLDYITPIKKVTFQTSLSPQKVAQRLENSISPKPKRKYIFEIPPVTYFGEITDKAFEIGQRQSGPKDHKPIAYGIIKGEQGGSLVEVKIIPNYWARIQVIFLCTLIVGFSCLAIYSKIESGNGDNFAIPVFLSFPWIIIYLLNKGRNTKLAKYIQQNIDGKIIK